MATVLGLLGIGLFPLVKLAALLLLQTTQRAALVWVRVFDLAVDLAALVVLWQVLCDRKTFRITEE